MPYFYRMPTLTRRRDRRSRHQKTWQIYYGDVRVGTIGERAGVPIEADPWGWNLGFYPGTEPPHPDGTAATFELARAAFGECWQQTLPTLTEAQFEAWRHDRDSHAWKHAMWDAHLKLPTQMPDGRARCFCGAEITIAGVDAHIRATHRGPHEQIR